MWTLIYIIILIQTTNICVAACGGVLTGENGTLSFPANQSEKYPNNVDCAWEIRGTLGKFIILTFTQFHMENHTQCNYDNLQIYDGPSASHHRIGKYCDITLPNGGTVQSTTHELYLSFHSDGSVTFFGFTLTWRSAYGGVLTGENGTLSFSANQSEKYPNNVDCAWEIRGTLGKIIILTFTQFSVEQDRGKQCIFDYLQIYDGPSASHHRIGQYCGTTLPNDGTVNSTTREMYLSFHSDQSVAHDGFTLTWRSALAVCGGVISGSNHGIINSPGYPGNYPINIDCVWRISVNPGNNIVLVFAALDLERHPNCNHDYLKIRDGSSNTSKLLGTYCNGSTLPASLMTTSPHGYILFHSDHRITGRGFQLAYAGVSGRCGGYFTSMNDSFSSPNYPSPYPHHSRCDYTIMVPEGYSITLTFTDFHVEADFDFVWVRENNLTLFHGTGSENITSINSSGNSLFVYFTSDYSVSKKGFSATYYTNRVVNGGWSSWLNWNSCTVNCGGGISRRSRDCINPAPSNGGTRCFGDSVESRVCNTNCCPVNGNWGMWSIWENCDVTCGIGIQKRTRACDNPYPVFDGFNCTGSDLQTQNCITTPCPVNGGWSSWLNWNSCTVNCGGGISRRSRDCINPAPSNGGTRCFGDSVESRVCNTNCCPVNGNWGMWSIWENCDVTCGIGIQKRTRACDNPYPVFDGFNCTGSDLQTQNCITTPCPVNGGWSSWLNWNSCSVSCGGGISTRSRDCSNPAPSSGGTRCFGDSVESHVCKTNCCPVNGNWGMWSTWKNCDVTCGFGIQQRTRVCDNPYPVFDGFICTGNDLQTQNCSASPCAVLVDRNTQLYSRKVVGGLAVACIICTSVMCLIVHLTIRRLRQNKGREETVVDVNEGGANYDDLDLRRTNQNYDNVEYIRPDNPQGDASENAERPASNVHDNLEENMYENLKY